MALTTPVVCAVYLCEAAFSAWMIIKQKYPQTLTNIQDVLPPVVPNIQPRFNDSFLKKKNLTKI